MILALAVGCPEMPGLLWWFMATGGVLHVLVAGVLLVTAWEYWQSYLRREEGA